MKFKYMSVDLAKFVIVYTICILGSALGMCRIGCGIDKSDGLTCFFLKLKMLAVGWV